MALYSIRTTRTQDIALTFSYDTYADKTLYPTKEAWFQHNIDMLVSDPMVVDHQRAAAVSFDQSFNTIPEPEQPTAKVEIETVITAHGGTIVPPGGPVQPPVP